MLRVQHDWETSLLTDLQPFWVNLYDSQGKLVSEASVRVAKDGNASRCLPPQGLQVSWIENQHRLDVAADQLRSSFYAPSNSYPISATLKGKNKLFSIGLSPEGALGVSGGADGQLRVWESADGTIRREFEGHHGDINACVFFPSGEVILSASADRFLKIWSVTEGYCAADLKGHALGVLSCDIIDRGRNVVSCSRDGTAKLWDVGTQECIATWEVNGALNAIVVGRSLGDSDLTGIQPHPKEVATEGKLLAIGAEDGHVHLYDVRSRSMIRKLAAKSAVNCIVAREDLSITCGTEKGAIQTWDLRSNSIEPRHIIAAHNGTPPPITSIVATNDGQGWASCADGICFKFNTNSNAAPIDTFLCGPDCDRINAIAASSNGSSTNLYTAGRDGLLRKYII